MWDRKKQPVLQTHGRVTGHWQLRIFSVSTASRTLLNSVTEVGGSTLASLHHCTYSSGKIDIQKSKIYKKYFFPFLMLLNLSSSSVCPVAPDLLSVVADAWNASLSWHWKYDSYSSLALVCQVEITATEDEKLIKVRSLRLCMLCNMSDIITLILLGLHPTTLPSRNARSCRMFSHSCL